MRLLTRLRLKWGNNLVLGENIDLVCYMFFNQNAIPNSNYLLLIFFYEKSLNRTINQYQPLIGVAIVYQTCARETLITKIIIK